MAFKPVDVDAKVATDLEYKVKSSFPAKGMVGNEIFTSTVTVRNLDAAKTKKFMLCALGDSVVLTGKTDMADAAPINIKLAAGQFQCTNDAKATARNRRFGNMGCQLVTLEKKGAKGDTMDVVFVTGQRPNPDTPMPLPIQDGVYNNLRNGAGFNGAGHRSIATKGYFGKSQPITKVLDDLTLHFILFDDQTLDMACRDVDKAPNGQNAYKPNCATVRPTNLACNQCFGMDLDFAVPKDAKGYSVHTETVKFGKVIVAAQLNIPFRVDTAVVQDFPSAIPAYLSVTSIPPDFVPCDVNLTAPCYKVTPTPDQFFSLTPDGTNFGTLTVSVPPALLDSFTGNFVLSVRQALDTNVSPSARDRGLDPVLVESLIPLGPFLLCDVTGDGVVDIDDIQAMMSVLEVAVDSPSPYDTDNDGIVTVADGRACSLRCAKPNCAR